MIRQIENGNYYAAFLLDEKLRRMERTENDYNNMQLLLGALWACNVLDFLRYAPEGSGLRFTARLRPNGRMSENEIYFRIETDLP